jgi:hypothetical protein
LHGPVESTRNALVALIQDHRDRIGSSQSVQLAPRGLARAIVNDQDMANLVFYGINAAVKRFANVVRDNGRTDLGPMGEFDRIELRLHLV